jgi:NAD(P)-dependent dehydrogenase (short-subunit alcohol dehydrogenase family)
MISSVPEKMLNKIVSNIPMRRLGEPDEVARVVEFLADPDSAYITGQVYSVNGGLAM